jgi:hypothetical protein
VTPQIRRSRYDSHRVECWLRGCTVDSVFVGSRMSSQAARNDKTAGGLLERNRWNFARSAKQWRLSKSRRNPVVAIGVICALWTGGDGGNQNTQSASNQFPTAGMSDLDASGGTITACYRFRHGAHGRSRSRRAESKCSKHWWEKIELGELLGGGLQRN